MSSALGDSVLVGILASMRSYFAARRFPDPDELAAEVVVRLLDAEKRGVVIENPNKFAYGIARNLRNEWNREPRPAPMDEARVAAETRDDQERAIQCLEKCRKSCLSARDTKLVDEFYFGTDKNKDRRQRLAAKLGITKNNLYQRAAIAREALRKCVEECVS